MHHAYIVFGNHTDGLETLRLLCDPTGERCQSHDWFVLQRDSGSVDDVRIIRDESIQGPTTSPIRIVVLSVSTLHEDAQQMLLKTFEEPGQNTIVGLIVPPGTKLLDTLISRAFVTVGGGSKDTLPFLLEEFLSSPPESRVTMLESILDNDNEEVTTKTTALSLLKGLEVRFLAEARSGNNSAVNVLLDIETMRPLLLQKGGVPKYVLEYLALTIPNV